MTEIFLIVMGAIMLYLEEVEKRREAALRKKAEQDAADALRTEYQ